MRRRNRLKEILAGKPGSEYVLQCQCIQWLRWQYPDVLFTSVPAGMKAHKIHAIKMKMMGYNKGYPDICIEEPRANYHGMRVELKTEEYRNRKNGGLSTDQIWWIDQLQKRAYWVKVCYNLDEFVEAVTDYMTMRGVPILQVDKLPINKK